ncbi:type VI secretion system-associated FHA domain protein TagH [Azospirillum picis]|uniref:Type VI secretion system FHA domain protein n=1 Tax=Azospirillum picis TaxID=488438 RepID=A0ABU0MFM5_9PROT|nr:type VI secretion system-associated FHA domain protein TagH [Azospirillum picis]MBP2298716.1 type VI secretion system FHA domain protein [Azospirillum picis]MDQ0532235.1 type VI secretion system FHA domain protein [Azospirillum picis]
MKLRLTLIQSPPAQGGDITRDLGSGRLVIGRGPDCDWILNDTERVLSKAHCMVEFKGGVYIVIDSSTNGVFLNDGPSPIGRGNSAVIGDGDRLRMGGFVMRAGFAADEAPAANDPFLAVLRGSDPPAAGGVPGGTASQDDPFAAAAFDRPPMPLTPIPEDDDLFGDLQPPGVRGAAADPDWSRSTQADFSPDSFGTMRLATEGGGGPASSLPPSGTSSIPDDWLDEPVDVRPAGGPPPAPVPPVTAAPSFQDDWDDDPLVPPAFGRQAPSPLPSLLPSQAAPAAVAAPDLLTRALAEVVLSLVQRQAALEALLGLDPEDTLAQGDSPLRRATDADDALARLRALPADEAGAMLRAAVADGGAHQSALLAAVRELAGETPDGNARLAALYRRLLPIHRHALGG